MATFPTELLGKKFRPADRTSRAFMKIFEWDGDQTVKVDDPGFDPDYYSLVSVSPGANARASLYKLTGGATIRWDPSAAAPAMTFVTGDGVSTDYVPDDGEHEPLVCKASEYEMEGACVPKEEEKGSKFPTWALFALVAAAIGVVMVYDK